MPPNRSFCSRHSLAPTAAGLAQRRAGRNTHCFLSPMNSMLGASNAPNTSHRRAPEVAPPATSANCFGKWNLGDTGGAKRARHGNSNTMPGIRAAA